MNKSNDSRDGRGTEGTGTVDEPVDFGLSRRGFLSASAVGVGALGLSAVASPAAAQGGDGNGESEPFSVVEFTNQPLDGRSVVVDAALLSEGGFVTIHDAGLFEGDAIGSVVGVSEFLDPGVHYLVEVELTDGADLSEGQPLVAMPHLDTNGNERYDFVETEGQEDGPYVEAGQAVVDLALVGADEDGTDQFATLEFSNQPTNGSSVVVDAVALSDGGFVAVHDASLLEGDVIGSVVGVSEFLEPGIHSGVQVPLFDVPGANFGTQTLEGTQPLIPMPHLDTNGNERYDFVETEGQEDGPYVEAGQAVVDLGFATVAGGDGGNGGS
ncbi:DUF7282 domain-containing protein [Halegenticoccus soli]|uniref:DUF7282 domain-containing protein n=1 Tax=Halegenticoccus soli TaxID=1985678 RepID=UPI000C6D4380|nr:twin-arginine translocation signal domain-containing protein [Halegenticoccus soli]